MSKLSAQALSVTYTNKQTQRSMMALDGIDFTSRLTFHARARWRSNGSQPLLPWWSKSGNSYNSPLAYNIWSVPRSDAMWHDAFEQSQYIAHLRQQWSQNPWALPWGLLAALRAMVDIDILVPEANIMAAIEQLNTLGYQPETPWLSLDAYLTYRHHLPPFIHPNKFPVIELHWQVTPPNRGYNIPVDELWSHRKPLTINGIQAEGLCPEDLLIHVCVHATYHHWFQNGVRSLCDVAEILRHYGTGFDWEIVVARATTWECQRGVFLALSAAQQLLGVKIQLPVLARLQPVKSQPFVADELQAFLFPEQQAVIVSADSYFWSFLRNPSLLAGTRAFKERLFLSPKEMATKYAIAINSPWLYYYGVRFKDLLGKFALKTRRMYFGDPTMTSMVEQQKRLQHWLQEPNV